MNALYVTAKSFSRMTYLLENKEELVNDALLVYLTGFNYRSL